MCGVSQSLYTLESGIHKRSPWKKVKKLISVGLRLFRTLEYMTQATVINIQAPCIRYVLSFLSEIPLDYMETL